MAMRSLAAMLGPLPRRVAGYATKASKDKPRTPESLMDDGSVEEVLRAMRPLFEQNRKYHEEEFRAYRRKGWLIAATGYGILGYIVTSAFRTIVKD